MNTPLNLLFQTPLPTPYIPEIPLSEKIEVVHAKLEIGCYLQPFLIRCKVADVCQQEPHVQTYEEGIEIGPMSAVSALPKKTVNKRLSPEEERDHKRFRVLDHSRVQSWYNRNTTLIFIQCFII